MRTTIKTLLATALLAGYGCTTPNKQSDIVSTQNNQDQPLNIILMIGDGMGVPQMSSAFYFGDSEPNFKSFETIGLSKTSSTSHQITDSAAGATAIATGEKTYKRAIGVTKDTVPQISILKQLQEQGYQTGLVSLTSITHATPASFYAHVNDRDQHQEIAQQLIESNIDFLAGGGKKYFNKRSDGINLFDSLQVQNYHLDTLSLSDMDPTRSNAFIIVENGLPSKTQGREDFLPKATQMGLEYFTANDAPFFFMIEGSYIDWGGHAKDDEMMIQEVLDFDRTIGVVLEFVNSHPNTLLVITADHETGGVSLGKSYDQSGTEIPDQVQVYFNSDQHSTELVPVLAKGKGSERFGGIYENTEIYHKMIQALKETNNEN